MSRFHAPEDSVTEQSVRMAHAYEYMVPVEAAWELEQALNKAREECHQLRLDRRSIFRAYDELYTKMQAGGYICHVGGPQ
jgi:hypothetical protein